MFSAYPFFPRRNPAGMLESLPVTSFIISMKNPASSGSLSQITIAIAPASSAFRALLTNEHSLENNNTQINYNLNKYYVGLLYPLSTSATLPSKSAAFLGHPQPQGGSTGTSLTP